MLQMWLFQVSSCPTCLVESTWHGLADLQETSQSESRCTCAGSRTSLQLHQNLESYKLIEWYWTWFIFKIMCVCMCYVHLYVCVCIHAISCLHTVTIWRAGTEKKYIKTSWRKASLRGCQAKPWKGDAGPNKYNWRQADHIMLCCPLEIPWADRC